MNQLIQAGAKTYYIHTGELMDVYIGVYRLSEEEVCLIDTGDGEKSTRVIDGILEQQGWRVKYIFNTHAHVDHLGVNKYFMEKWGCPAYTTGAANLFSNEIALKAASMLGGFRFQELNQVFVPPGPIRLQAIEDFALPEGFATIPLEGHAFGMIGIKTPDDVWFLGDSVLNRKSLQKYQFGNLVDVGEYLKNLDTLETLSGRMFIPGHGEATDDICQPARENRQNVLRIIDFILEVCKDGKPFDWIVKAVFDRYCIPNNVVQYYVISITLRGYITYLKDRGRLCHEFRDNLFVWKSV